MNKDAKIYIAGHRGMVGSALMRRLQKSGYYNFVIRTSADLDLRHQEATARFASILPIYKQLSIPNAICATARVIFRVTKVSPRSGLS